ALDGRQSRGDRLRRGAQLPRCHHGLEELDAVGQPDGDEGVARDAEARVGAGQLVGPRFHLRARARVGATRQRGPVRIGAGQLAHPDAEGSLVAHLPARLRSGTARSSSASAAPRLSVAWATPLKWPSRATTRSCEGTITVNCPPAPAMKYASGGTGNRRSPLIQKKPP